MSWGGLNVIKNPDVWGRVTFAEDCRQEVGNSISIIGIPMGHVRVDEFPAIFTKFAVISEITTPPDIDCDVVHLRMYLPGAKDRDDFYFEEEVRLSKTSPSDGQKAPSAQAQLSEPVFPTNVVRRSVHVAVHSGLAVEKPGWIEIRARVGDDIIALGALMITR